MAGEDELILRATLDHQQVLKALDEIATHSAKLEKSSDGITSQIGAKHYVFIDNDSILDVVSTGKPEFEIIKVK